MRKHLEVSFGDRVVVRSDRDFTVWAVGEDETFLVGPHSAGQRITSFTVPRGCKEVMVDCDADSVTTLDRAQNRYSAADPRTLVSELEEDRPESVRDMIANTVAEAMRRSKLVDSEPESIEEANDFDMDFEAWGDEDFALAHAYKELEDEFLQANSDVEAEKQPDQPAASQPDEEPVVSDQETSNLAVS